MSDELSARKSDIFKARPLIAYDDELNFSEVVDQFNALIVKNNDAATSLNDRQTKAREALRLDCVNRFVKDIDLPTRETNTAKLKQESESLYKQQETLANVVKVREAEIITEKTKTAKRKKCCR